METNFKEWLAMQEMALRKMELVPPHNPEDPKSAWGPKGKKYGWDTRDAKLVTSPAGVEKMRNLWANTEQLADYCNYALNEVMEEAKGRVFVM